jgi:thiol:disulfide interchange protein
MLAEKFTVAGRATGYLHSPDFLSFLQQAREGTGSEKNLLQRVVDRYGLVVAMLLVIPLGLLLNLTPCVLPMIPINLAIIGAGAQAGSQKRGFLLGAVYGSGMALVYGVLGLVVVTTGARFGALNSSPWFNLVIAAVFIALGLAMFDVFVIDFSRFQGGTPGDDDSSSKAPFVTAFLVGGMAALLAGACVAPVLIWVLVLAIDLYAGGSPVVGLMLPFLLGIGMALPWPFAGAGLSFLPKPGGWMNHVKHAFGILIFIAAIYYGHQAVVLFRDSGEADVVQTAETASGQEDEWLSSLTDGLRRGLAENKPVFLDFWALSCKSCMKMKRTTFKDPDVVNALDSYVKVAFQADDTEAPRVKNVLQYYDVLGLPTYIVLEPAADANTETNRSKR